MKVHLYRGKLYSNLNDIFIDMERSQPYTIVWIMKVTSKNIYCMHTLNIKQYLDCMYSERDVYTHIFSLQTMVAFVQPYLYWYLFSL